MKQIYYTKSQLKGAGKYTEKEIKYQLCRYFGWRHSRQFTFVPDALGVHVLQKEDIDEEIEENA